VEACQADAPRAPHATTRPLRGPIAAEDIEIGGATIKAGEGVIIPFRSANRDASVFNVPNRLDMSREPRRHLAVG
jgi:cytochrome P450